MTSPLLCRFNTRLRGIFFLRMSSIARQTLIFVVIAGRILYCHHQLLLLQGQQPEACCMHFVTPHHSRAWQPFARFYDEQPVARVSGWGKKIKQRSLLFR